MNEEVEKPDVEDPPEDDLEPRASRAKDTARAMNSGLRDFWLHLRVWIPFLHNPLDRKCLVKFSARDSRVGMEWTIHMPRQCWKCGVTENLRSKQFESDVRCYEFAMQILGGMLAGVLLGLLLICWLTLFASILIGLSLVGGLVVMRLKSWPEYVTLTMSGCPKHAEGMAMPDAVSDDGELYVYALSTTQAAATRAELKDARNRGRRAADAGGSGGPGAAAAAQVTSGSASAPRETPYAPPPGPREELPPIKLAGEADEQPAPRPALGKTSTRRRRRPSSRFARNCLPSN